MQIHSRKMNVSKDINFEELARCTDDFNCAQLKAVCVEAGMLALRRGASELVCIVKWDQFSVVDGSVIGGVWTNVQRAKEEEEEEGEGEGEH